MVSMTSRMLVAGIAAFAVTASPVLAAKASTLQSLVGARGSSGEAELQAKGFVMIDASHGDGAVYTHWWNAQDKNCISVRTEDGRYAAIVDTMNADCKQPAHSGGHTGTAVAGAAVGLALIAALTSHKSHHHEGNQHLTDAQAEAQYERGYNDGLHNAAYHNPNKLDAYSSGYSAGVDQRGRNLSSHSGRGGYAPHVSLDGLKGRDSVWAIDEMSSRGFANVDSFTSGNTQYGIYWNRATRQCVQMTYADSKVYDARDIGQHPKCR